MVPEEVEQVLRHGTLNRRMSKFGGKPSPVFVFEAALGPELAAPAAAGLEEAPTCRGPAGGSSAAAASAAPAAAAAAAPGGTVPQAAEGAAAGHCTAAAVAAAQGIDAVTAAAAGAQQQQERRQLRVMFAAHEDATVVLTAIDLLAAE